MLQDVIERGELPSRVACLADIIKSKRAADRNRDRAVLEILQKTLDEQEKTEK